MKPTYTTIDEYIATFPADVQAILQKSEKHSAFEMSPWSYRVFVK